MHECRNELLLKDDYGENDCTFCCERQPGHKGKHRRTMNSEWVMEWEQKQGAADGT